MLTRKELLKSLLLAGAASTAPLSLATQATPPQDTTGISLDDLKSFEKVAGINFSDDERKQILAAVRGGRQGFEAVRKLPIDYTTEPRTVFTPIGGAAEQNPRVEVRPSPVGNLDIKKMSDEDIAFLSVRELGHLVQTRQISPVRLTDIYLSRLKQYGEKLLCVVNLTEERARTS